MVRTAIHQATYYRETMGIGGIGAILAPPAVMSGI
jgi:hypothetical protein